MRVVFLSAKQTDPRHNNLIIIVGYMPALLFQIVVSIPQLLILVSIVPLMLKLCILNVIYPNNLQLENIENISIRSC